MPADFGAHEWQHFCFACVRYQPARDPAFQCRLIIDPIISPFSHTHGIGGPGPMRWWRFGTILSVHALIASSALFNVGPAAAQDNPRAEVYLGYAALAGFSGSVTVNMNRWFGVVGDYGYRVAEYYADKPLQTFTAGPRLTLRLLPQLTPYAHLLPGKAGSLKTLTPNRSIHTISFCPILCSGPERTGWRP